MTRPRRRVQRDLRRDPRRRPGRRTRPRHPSPRRANHRSNRQGVPGRGAGALGRRAKSARRHHADAITIECLFLKHRKPCLSFALNNGELVPCGCENDLNASLEPDARRALFGRGGFQHNPGLRPRGEPLLRRPTAPAPPNCTARTATPPLHDLRPFFHQLPKTLALDVQWPAGETGHLVQYHSEQEHLDTWQGEIVSSPGTPPTGGCATRVMVRFPGVEDVCSVYPGPHPVHVLRCLRRPSRDLCQTLRDRASGQS